MIEQKYVDYWRDRQAKEKQYHQALAAQAWVDVQKIAKLLVSEFGATQVIVFGSLVKNDRFDAESDLDIAVAGIPPEDFFPAMSAANCITQQWVDLKPIEALDPYFLQRVLETGKMIDAEGAIG